MLSIHLEVKDFGNKDKMNYETDEINKENMRVLHFIADQKLENTKHTNLLQVLSKEGVEGSKRQFFSTVKLL